MHTHGLRNLYIYAFLIWFFIGLAFILPKKIKLLKRVGNVGNGDLIRLAKNGDTEAVALRRVTWIFVVVGILILVPLRIFS